MIQMATESPAHDPAMELLCLLPKRPGTALLKDLVEDLGLKRQGQLRKLLQELRGKGYRIGSRRVPGLGSGCWLDVQSWYAAKREGVEYLAALDRYANLAAAS